MIINKQEELEALIDSNNDIIIEDDLIIRCDINIDTNINARNINARNIKAMGINARNINAWDINAGDINAGDINARNINAVDIKAGDINARNINAGDIEYYAACYAYNSIICKSIKGQRTNSKHFVLDGELKIKEEDAK